MSLNTSGYWVRITHSDHVGDEDREGRPLFVVIKDNVTIVKKMVLQGLRSTLLSNSSQVNMNSVQG